MTLTTDSVTLQLTGREFDALKLALATYARLPEQTRKSAAPILLNNLQSERTALEIAAELAPEHVGPWATNPKSKPSIPASPGAQ